MLETNRRTLLGASAATVALLAACQQTTTNTNLGATLDHLSVDILKLSPEAATSLAVSEEQAGGRYIDKSSDASRAGLQAQKALAQRTITELSAINVASLSAQDKVSLDVVKSAAEDNLNALQWEVGGGATAPYVVTQLTGVYQGIPDFLDSQHPLRTKDQAEAYITRIGGFATQLDQETARIGEDATAGVIPPDFAIKKAIELLGGLAGKAAADSTLVKSIQRRIVDIAEIPAGDRAGYVTRAQTEVQQKVLPAMQRQLEALRGILPRATHDAGVWKQPHGDEMYAAALRAYTTTTMSPDEVHTMGTELAAQLTSQMDAILKAQGMNRGTVAERVRELSNRPDQLYANTDAARQQLLDELNRQVQAIRARMPEVCGTLAHADLQIKRVPPEIEDGAPGGYYNGAALDGSRPGSYYINLRPSRDRNGRPRPFLYENPKFTLPTLTYHEGVPGHHWQISIQQEAGELPFIRRALLGFNAYAEGWGLYAEQLADEMGMYGADATGQLGKLGYYQSAAFRASRLVVDTGMHAKHWTREQAIQSMMGVTGDIESNVVTEIERYAVWPGQACGYMVGRQAINRYREAAKQSMGSRFDLKGFHDVVLTNGSLPLSVLERLVNEWAARPA